MQRLDKIISSQLNISRSDARTDIRRGKVSVNGNTVRDPSLQSDPDTAEICYLGQPLSYKKYIYIIMNKPKGCVCTVKDDKGRRCAFSINR